MVQEQPHHLAVCSASSLHLQSSRAWEALTNLQCTYAHSAVCNESDVMLSNSSSSSSTRCSSCMLLTPVAVAVTVLVRRHQLILLLLEITATDKIQRKCVAH
jgi:hypothetical protein